MRFSQKTWDTSFDLKVHGIFPNKKYFLCNLLRGEKVITLKARETYRKVFFFICEKETGIGLEDHGGIDNF